MRTRVVVAVGLVALGAASLVILTDRAQRRSGTDLTTDTGYAIELGPGVQLCQPGELLPADTAALRLDADPLGAPGPALAVRTQGSAGTISAGYLRSGWRRGAVRILLARLSAEGVGTVCVLNVGLRPIGLGGELPAQGFQIEVAGKTFPGRLRIEYLRPGSESWLTLLPTIAHRFSLGKSDLVRSWAAVAALLLMIFAVALATATVLREAS